MSTPTLAEKLGQKAPDSCLLKKAAGLGLHSQAKLEALAVARGCTHYASPGMILPAVSEADFTNEELAIALLSPALAYSAHTIRVGGAMLSAIGSDPKLIARLATQEGAVAPVRYIANAALQFEPENAYWTGLLELLPQTLPIADGVMPHPTRFVSMTGITRGKVGRVVVWLRPTARPELAHG